jgi:hypothetical protein
VSGAPTAPVDPNGGDFTVTVTAGAGCAWSASSTAAFITINGAASGSGTGSVRFSVQSNGGAARQGSITVATHTIAIQQAAAAAQTCEFSISPTSATVPIGGGDQTISITATSGVNCPWTSASNDAFISVTSGTSGSGSGTTVLAIASNPGEARAGTATVAGRQVSILQEGTAAAPCAFSVSPTQANVSAAGGSVVVTVTKISGGTCPWIVQSPGQFITTQGGPGVNDGTVTVFIAANPGPGPRSDTVIVAGQLVTLNQPAPVIACAFVVAPMVINAFSTGGTPQIAITNTAGFGCPWTAVSNDDWITITSGSSGTGGGNVRIRIAANTGPARTGTLTIAGQTVTVNQNTPTPCLFSVTPTSYSAPAVSSSFMLAITQTSGESCDWTGTSSEPWIRWITGQWVGGFGSHPALQTFVLPNSDSTVRTGTINIAGQVVTITQAPGLPANTTAVVTYQSDPGDLVAQGQSGTATFVGTSQFIAQYTADGTLEFFTTGGAQPTMSINLRAPSGQPLAPGLYENAYSFQFGQTQFPRLDVAMFHRACASYGRFIISELTITDGLVSRMHASFEQYCEFSSPALRGSIWIDAGGSASPPPAPVLVTPSTPTTFFNYISDPTDVLGGGLSQSFTMANSNFTARHDGSDVRIRAYSSDFDRSIVFKGSVGVPPGVGTYDPAQFQLIGWGACASVTGKFTVLEATYAPGGIVKRFRATYEIHCGSATAALKGEVYIVADPWR